METAYFYMMYTLRRRLAAHSSSRGLGEFQAHALVLFVDIILVSNLLFTFFAEELKALAPGAYVFGVVLAFPLLAFNLTLFKRDGDKWLRHEHRFGEMTARKRVVASTLVEIFVVLTFTSPLLLDRWVWH